MAIHIHLHLTLHASRLPSSRPRIRRPRSPHVPRNSPRILGLPPNLLLHKCLHNPRKSSTRSPTHRPHMLPRHRNHSPLRHPQNNLLTSKPRKHKQQPLLPILTLFISRLLRQRPPRHRHVPRPLPRFLQFPNNNFTRRQRYPRWGKKPCHLQRQLRLRPLEKSRYCGK